VSGYRLAVRKTLRERLFRFEVVRPLEISKKPGLNRAATEALCLCDGGNNKYKDGKSSIDLVGVEAGAKIFVP
jgi:hypothetical protein